MAQSSSRRRGNGRKSPTSFYLSTPLYIATTICSLTAQILLISSGDGFIRRRSDAFRREDDLLMFPIITLFFSLMTGPIRCFFWVLSFGVQVAWLRRKESRIKLGDEEDEGNEEMSKSCWTGRILFSWNAWVAAALTASLGVLIWRYAENAEGRMFNPAAGFGAGLLGVSCVLHALLALPGYADRKFVFLLYPFQQEYQLLDTTQDGATEEGDWEPST